MKVEGSHLEANDGGKKKASFEKHQMEDIEDIMHCQMDFPDMYEVSYKFISLTLLYITPVPKKIDPLKWRKNTRENEDGIARKRKFSRCKVATQSFIRQKILFPFSCFCNLYSLLIVKLGQFWRWPNFLKNLLRHSNLAVFYIANISFYLYSSYVSKAPQINFWLGARYFIALISFINALILISV